MKYPQCNKCYQPRFRGHKCKDITTIPDESRDKRIAELEAERDYCKTERDDYKAKQFNYMYWCDEKDDSIAELEAVVSNLRDVNTTTANDLMIRKDEIDRLKSRIKELEESAKISYGNYTRKATECIKSRARIAELEAQVVQTNAVKMALAMQIWELAGGYSGPLPCEGILSDAEAKVKERLTNEARH